MTSLNKREKLLLLVCFLVIFTMANLIAIRFVKKNWGGGSSEIRALETELADLEMWLEDADMVEKKERWLWQNTPTEMSMTKAQGDLLQFLQDDLFQRKIQIEKQALQEPEYTDSFQEVAVSLKVRGPEKNIIEWLTTLQGAKKFQVIKRLELELDRRSKEETPQAVCEIVLARWFAPPGENPYADEVESEPAAPSISEDQTTSTETTEQNDGSITSNNENIEQAAVE